MKLIIDIHEKDYQSILNSGQVPYDVVYAIMNGTPLPKGHGKLIDADVLGEKLHRYSEAPYQYALAIFNDSPIIIEADKED